MDTAEITIPVISTTGNISGMQFPSIEDYNQWDLYKNRIICLDGEIEDWDYHIVKDIIHFNIADYGIEPEKRIPIILLINSCGGLLNISNSIIDAITISKTPVWTVNMGEALSGGCLIFLAGEKRFTTPNSWCMVHAGSGGIAGNYNETKEQSKVWDTQVKNLGNWVISRTGIDTKTYNKYKNKDWWLTCSQQLEFGFATKQIESIDEIMRVV
jgi:ATP-dependent Clp protease protease subunit